MAVKEFIQDNNGNVTVEKDTGEVGKFNLADSLAVGDSGLIIGGQALTAEQEALLGLDVQLADYTALRSYAGNKTRVYITGALGGSAPSGIAGTFVHRAGDTTSTDNGGTIIVDGAGRRWHREFADAVNVQWFGTIGNGTADDSDAFARAFASGWKKFIVPRTPVYYKVKDLDLPAGCELQGVGRRRVYTAFDVADIEGSCAIVFDTTGDYFINFVGNNSVENINFHGVDRSVDGFGPDSGGSLFFRDVSFFRFANGFGKASGSYTGNSRFWNCQASGNTTGIRNFVDSHFYGFEVNANEGVGINMQAGANDNTFIGTKNEWNNETNWVFFQSQNNTIVGGVTDRSGGLYGFDVRQSHLVINGTVIRRSGRSDAAASAHMLLGSNSALILSGVQFRHGANDDGSGLDTPARIFHVADSASGPVSINGCDLTGSTTGEISSGTTLQAAYSGNLGIPDVQTPWASANSTVADGASLTMSVPELKARKLSADTSSVRRYRLLVNVRNSSTGLIFVNNFEFIIQRPASSLAVGFFPASDPLSTSINTTGASVNISVTNIANDGATFDVVAANESGGSRQIVMSLVVE